MDDIAKKVLVSLKGTSKENTVTMGQIAEAVGAPGPTIKTALLRLQNLGYAGFGYGPPNGYYLGRTFFDCPVKEPLPEWVRPALEMSAQSPIAKAAPDGPQPKRGAGLKLKPRGRSIGNDARWVLSTGRVTLEELARELGSSASQARAAILYLRRRGEHVTKETRYWIETSHRTGK